MIVLITCEEKWHYDRNGQKTCLRSTPITVVSHGVDESMNNVILPCESLDYYIREGAKLNHDIGEWCLYD